MPYNYPEGACWEKNVFHIIFHYHGLMGLRRDQDISQTEIIEVRSSSSQPIFSRSCKTAAAADPQHRRSFQLRGQGGRDLSPARRLLYITPRAAVRVTAASNETISPISVPYVLLSTQKIGNISHLATKSYILIELILQMSVLAFYEPQNFLIWLL